MQDKIVDSRHPIIIIIKLLCYYVIRNSISRARDSDWYPLELLVVQLKQQLTFPFPSFNHPQLILLECLNLAGVASNLTHSALFI